MRARNTATASANKIHDDEVARTYGFRGGLVPGVILYAYMTHPVVQRFGLAFLERGSMSAKFIHPVYDGGDIEARAEGDGPMQLSLLDASGEVCATGEASLEPSPGAVDLDSYGQVPLPVSPPRASPDAFVAAPVLGVVDGVFDRAGSEAYLQLIDEDLPVYRDSSVAHPGWLLAWANLALTSNFTLGPWIHVSSEVQHFSLLRDGAKLAALGRVAGSFERKGHRFVDLDVVLIGDGDSPVARIRHLAIYEPRRTEGHDGA